MHAGGDGRVGVWWGGWGPSEADTQKNAPKEEAPGRREDGGPTKTFV